MRTNAKATNLSYNNGQTHEGAPAAKMTPEQALRRSVMSCMLFEDTFYEDGEEIATRIQKLAAEVPLAALLNIAREARHVANLRHVPLLLLVGAIKRGGPGVAEAIDAVVTRADELTELVALYWKMNPSKRASPKNAPLSAQMKRGLAMAFQKFDEYKLAKYNRDSEIKLKDVLFLCHAKPRDDAQAALWKRLVAGELATPDTWEVALSAGQDKRVSFTRLLAEGKLGYLALLRNLRNMADAGVDERLVENAIRARKGGAERVLPFRYVAAARAAPRFERAIDDALCAAIEAAPRLPGRTVVLVDVSNSMSDKLSAKSDMSRLDAACALASLINAEHLRVFSFSSKVDLGAHPSTARVPWTSLFMSVSPQYGRRQALSVVECPPRRGMAGVDAIQRSQERGGTLLFSSVKHVNDTVPYDRIIVITDEQAFGAASVSGGEGDPITRLPDPRGKGYMINVAANKHGVGYGAWTHLDGFSESVIRFIAESERADFR